MKAHLLLKHVPAIDVATQIAKAVGAAGKFYFGLVPHFSIIGCTTRPLWSTGEAKSNALNSEDQSPQISIQESDRPRTLSTRQSLTSGALVSSLSCDTLPSRSPNSTSEDTGLPKR